MKGPYFPNNRCEDSQLTAFLRRLRQVRRWPRGVAGGSRSGPSQRPQGVGVVQLLVFGILEKRGLSNTGHRPSCLLDLSRRSIPSGPCSVTLKGFRTRCQNMAPWQFKYLKLKEFLEKNTSRSRMVPVNFPHLASLPSNRS